METQLTLPTCSIRNFVARSIITYSIIISVPDIPPPYTYEQLDGPTALTSLDGKGAFLQQGENFFELTCDTSSCTWSVMEQSLDVGRFGTVMTYLPSGFECHQG